MTGVRWCFLGMFSPLTLTPLVSTESVFEFLESFLQVGNHFGRRGGCVVEHFVELRFQRFPFSLEVHSREVKFQSHLVAEGHDVALE